MQYQALFEKRQIALIGGKISRRRAEEVLPLIDKIEQEVREPGGPVDGTGSIGSAEAAATEILPPPIRSRAGGIRTGRSPA